MVDLLTFRNETVDYIHHMSKYCHLMEDVELRASYREIKKSWLLLMYRNGLVDNLVYQNSHSNDMLVWFHIGHRSFHLRKKHFNPGDIPMVEELHEKDTENTLESIDFSFVNKLEYIRSIIKENN